MRSVCPHVDVLMPLPLNDQVARHSTRFFLNRIRFLMFHYESVVMDNSTFLSGSRVFDCQQNCQQTGSGCVRTG